jgi:S-adenosylmethionine:tRNA ribosyltransferase-isomerase
LKLTDFLYDLPPELIAQKPLEKRDQARLLVYRKPEIQHKSFSDLPELIRQGDLLVLNDSRVISCRLMSYKEETHGRIEILLLKKIDKDGHWEALLKPLNRTQVGKKLEITSGLFAVLETPHSDGEKNIVRLNRDVSFEELEKIAYAPLPPYIHRDYRHYSAAEADRDRQDYQTVYAGPFGSVASPTAGLHFTSGLLDKVRARGAQITNVTLDVSLGTFKPVETENIGDHRMHSEHFRISEESARLINGCKGRVIAVGTTSARVLESVFQKYGEARAADEETSIFITPGFTFKRTDCLITNFHLPGSTLLMLVSAFIGLEETRRIYELAILEKYRFYSFGDAMWLERKN